MHLSSLHSAPDPTLRLRPQILAALAETKSALLARYEQRLPGQHATIRTLLHEAELAAWKTNLPHLFFVDLAEEKISHFEASAIRQFGEEVFAYAA